MAKLRPAMSKKKKNKGKINKAKSIKAKTNIAKQASTIEKVKEKIINFKVENVNDKAEAEVVKGKLKGKKAKGVKTPEEKVKNSEIASATEVKTDDNEDVTKVKPAVLKNQPDEELKERYPMFKDEEFVNNFLSVSMNNNQKGRVRQQLKDSVKDASEKILPDVLHNKIKNLSQSPDKLTDPNLRKIRLLYNMLRVAIQNENNCIRIVQKKKKKSKKNKKNGVKDADEDEDLKPDEKIEKDASDAKADNKNIKDKKSQPDGKAGKDNKVKGPKRYVVFVGNLPLDVDNEKIMQHFSDIKEQIVNVRIPDPVEGKKSTIAFVELKNASSYELALSKHHSMMSNKRINVMFTAQKNSKLTKTEAKGKAAKMAALQTSGKLAGSAPLIRKRSQRRKKAKLAQKQLENE